MCYLWIMLIHDPQGLCASELQQQTAVLYISIYLINIYLYNIHMLHMQPLIG